VILLTASQVLLMNWLMERLNRFSEQHQNIDIRLDVTERLSDVIHGEADLGVRCGPGDWAGLSKTWLMDEEAVIVCSPRLLGTGARPSPQWLAGEKRIQDDTPHPGAGFPSWDTIFERLKAPPAGTTTLHINSTAAAIMTALSGRGVAVVRRALVQQLIDTNQLVLLFPEHRWPLTWSYYLVMSEHSRMRPEVKILHDWLVQDVSESQISS
jgi:LysR family glycine cleavage system transcriptional activator